MTYYAELTFQSFYYGEPYAKSTLVLNAQTKKDLTTKVQDSLEERIMHTATCHTQLDKQKYYER